jgi:hypothetical protein
MGITSNKSLFNKFNYTKDSLILIHQNIRGLGGKIGELKCSIVSKNVNPHLICLSEHHMLDQKLSYSNFQNYSLGTKYACTIHQGGGVCVYIYIYISDIKFTAINLAQFCDEKNIEIGPDLYTLLNLRCMKCYHEFVICDIVYIQPYGERIASMK